MIANIRVWAYNSHFMAGSFGPQYGAGLQGTRSGKAVELLTKAEPDLTNPARRGQNVFISPRFCQFVCFTGGFTQHTLLSVGPRSHRREGSFLGDV